MTKKELRDFVLDKLGLDKGNSIITAHADTAIKQIHDDIWNAKDWLATINTVIIPNAEEVERLPHYIRNVLAASYDNAKYFRIKEQQDIILSNPEVFDSSVEQNGTTNYMEVSPTVGVLVSPNATQITVESSSASDTSVVAVVGVLNGEDVVEEITLAGTSPQSSVSAFDEIYTLSKIATTGKLTAKRGDGTVIQTLLPHETSRTHKRIRLVAAPADNTKTLVLLVKMNPVGFVNDNDAPMLNGIDGAIKKGLEAEMLEYDEQYDKASVANKGATAILNLKVEEENNSQERNITISMEPVTFSGHRYRRF